jgi:hypothetical protein
LARVFVLPLSPHKIKTKTHLHTHLQTHRHRHIDTRRTPPRLQAHTKNPQQTRKPTPAANEREGTATRARENKNNDKQRQTLELFLEKHGGADVETTVDFWAPFRGGVLL